MSRVRCVCRRQKRRDVGQATTNSRREYKRADACMSKSDPNKDLTTRSRA